jgi:dienelactone hydrolase
MLEEEPPGWLDAPDIDDDTAYDLEHARNWNPGAGLHIPDLTPTPDPRIPPDAPIITEPLDLDITWWRVDLTNALKNEIATLEPAVLVCEDKRALFYASCVNGIHADSGIGKSWIAGLAAAQQLAQHRHVAWIDFEDPNEATLIGRLRDDLGVPPDLILEYLHYRGPKEPFTDLAVDAVEQEARRHDTALIVIDSLGEAFGLEGIDENADKEVGPWVRRVARRLADTGAAVLLIDHATKAADNPLHPSGSKRKRAAITGASYLVEAPRPLTREDGGQLRLTVAKDRHGHRRRGAEACTVDFTLYPDGGLTVHLWPPSAESRTAHTAAGQMHGYAKAAVKAAKKARRALSTRELVGLMQIKAGTENKRAGIDQAVALGALRTEMGPRNSTLHIYAHDLEDPEKGSSDDV